MPGINQPTGQFSSPTRGLGELQRPRTSQNQRSPPCHDLAQLERVAANMDRDVLHLVFGHSHRGRQVWTGFLQRGQFIPQCFQLCLRLGRIQCLQFLRHPGTGLLAQFLFRLLVCVRRETGYPRFFCSHRCVELRLQLAGFSRWQQVFMPFGHLDVLPHCQRALEDARQPVVVRRGYRIELVVVTTCTSQCQSKERPAHRVELLVDDVHPHLGLVCLGQHLGANAEEPRRDQLIMLLGLTVKRHQIAGQLLDDEPIERLVAVERRHDIVPVPPGVAVGNVLVEPVGIRVAGHVEPMSSPAFPVSRRRQQAAHNPRERVRRPIGKKCGHLRRCWGQADEVKSDPAEQCPPIGTGRGRQSGCLELGQDVIVDSRLWPVPVLDRRHWLNQQRLERPVVGFLGLVIGGRRRGKRPDQQQARHQRRQRRTPPDRPGPAKRCFCENLHFSHLHINQTITSLDCIARVGLRRSRGTSNSSTTGSTGRCLSCPATVGGS